MLAHEKLIGHKHLMLLSLENERLAMAFMLRNQQVSEL